MKLRTLGGLLFCNLIWSANPAMCKLVFAEGASPSLMACLRYGSALLAFTLFSFRRQPFLIPRQPRDFGWLLVIGGMGFCLAPLMQLTGLYASQATDNALIIAMEPLITVLLAWLVLGESLGRLHVIAFGVALGGFALLTGLTPARVMLAWNAPDSREGEHLLGNLLILLAIVGEACYSVAGRKLLGVHSARAARGIFGSALAIGVVFLTLALLWTLGPAGFAPLLHLSPQAWLAVFFVGPLGTAFTYLYWMIALTEAPVASLVLTLFIQPVFGSIWGYAFLDERLGMLQWAGAFLILAAVALQGAAGGAEIDPAVR